MAGQLGVKVRHEIGDGLKKRQEAKDAAEKE